MKRTISKILVLSLTVLLSLSAFIFARVNSVSVSNIADADKAMQEREEIVSNDEHKHDEERVELDNHEESVQKVSEVEEVDYTSSKVKVEEQRQETTKQVSKQEPVQEEAKVPSKEEPVQEEVKVPSKEEPKQEEVKVPSKEEPKQEVEKPSKEEPKQEEVEKPSKEEPKQEVEKPSEEEPKQEEVKVPSEEEPKQELEKPSKEETKQEVEKPSKEETKQELEKPSEEEPKQEEVKVPSKEEPKQEVENPSKEEAKQEVEEPSEEEVKPEIKEPDKEEPKPEENKPSNEKTEQKEEQKNPEEHVHTFSSWKVVLEATCRTTGEKTRQCTVCGKEETEIININLNAHKYIDLPDEEPTCERSGKIHYKVCELCKNNTFKLVLPLGHEWSNEYTVDQEATCKKDGHMSHHCTREGCFATDEPVVLKATGHNLVEVRKEATCTASGTLTIKCTKCDYTGRKQVISGPKGHEYSEYVSDENATCTHDGTKTATCMSCGNRLTVVDEHTKLEHEFITLNDKILPTCETVGREASQKCKNCDTVVKGNTIGALGHQFVVMQLPGEKAEESIKCIRCHIDYSEGKITFGAGHKWTKDDEGHDICDCGDEHCNHEDSTWWKLWKRNEEGDRDACIWFVGFTCNLERCVGFNGHDTPNKVDTVIEGRRGGKETIEMEAPEAKAGWRFAGWYEVTADGQGKKVESNPSENGTYANGNKITVGWKDMEKGFEARYEKAN